MARLVIYADAAMPTLSQVAATRGPTSEDGVGKRGDIGVLD